MSLLPAGRKEGGQVVPSNNRAGILGEPICWRCWETDLSPGGTRKVVPSKRVWRSPLRTGFPWPPLRERARPGGHEGKWFLRKKYGAFSGARPLDFCLNRGNEEKWFRKENVPGTLFVAELEGLPVSP